MGLQVFSRGVRVKLSRAWLRANPGKRPDFGTVKRVETPEGNHHCQVTVRWDSTGTDSTHSAPSLWPEGSPDPT